MKQEHEQFLKNKMLRTTLAESKAHAIQTYRKKSCERARKVRQELKVRRLI